MTLFRKEQPEHRMPQSSLRNRIATGFLASVMALSTPLLENRAYAQPPPAKTEAQEPKPAPVPSSEPAAAPIPAQYEVKAETALMSDGSMNPKVYIVSRQAGKLPIVEVEGPAKMTLLFYPAVLPEWFPSKDIEVARKLEYTFGPVTGEQKQQSMDGMTKLSEFKSPEIDAKVLGIGTPISLTIIVPKGRHIVSFTSPNGFLEVASVAPYAPPKPVEVPKPVVVKAPEKKPEQKAQIEEKRGFSLELKGEHLWVSELGQNKNNGMLTDAELLLKNRWSMLGVYGGVLTTSYGMSLDTAKALSMLRMTSIDAMAGLSLHFGAHTIYAGPLGGVRLVDQSISAKVPVISPDGPGMQYQFEFGGKAGYEVDYDSHRLFGLFVRGTNNPYNPVTGGLYLISPWGWAPDHNNPELSFTMRWMHLMKPREDKSVGGYNLDESNLLMHGNLIIPIWKLGPIIPSALIGLEMNNTFGGSFAAQPFFGGALKAQFMKGLYLQAGAAVNLEKNPFLLLQLSYE